MLTIDRVYKASRVLKEVIRETDMILAPNIRKINAHITARFLICFRIVYGSLEENNIPKIIEYWPESSVMGWRLLKSQRFEFLEINTNRYAEIPKSFIDFCKEQGIEPPEECEHLHYV